MRDIHRGEVASECSVLNGAAERMLAGTLKACRTGEHNIIRELAECDHLIQGRLPARERSGFIEHDRVDVAQGLDGFSVAEEHPQLGAATGRNHDRNRRGKPQRARTGDDQYCHGIHQCVRQSRLRSE